MSENFFQTLFVPSSDSTFLYRLIEFYTLLRSSRYYFGQQIGFYHETVSAIDDAATRNIHVVSRAWSFIFDDVLREDIFKTKITNKL